MSKISKGPWKIQIDRGTRKVIKSADGRTVCVVESWTRNADARLMAASPKMLYALTSVYTSMVSAGTDKSELGAEVEEAIRVATEPTDMAQ